MHEQGAAGSDEEEVKGGEAFGFTNRLGRRKLRVQEPGERGDSFNRE